MVLRSFAVIGKMKLGFVSFLRYWYLLSHFCQCDQWSAERTVLQGHVDKEHHFINEDQNQSSSVVLKSMKLKIGFVIATKLEP